jgi:Zn-finger nucleic acid-binding protein
LLAKLGVATALLDDIAATGKAGLSCPGCSSTMKAFPLKGIEVDRCGSCGALWLDGSEREQIEGAAPAARPKLSAAEIEAREARRAARRQRADADAFMVYDDRDAAAQTTPLSTGQLVLLTLGGLFMIIAGLSILLTGEAEVTSTNHFRPTTTHVEGGGAYLIAALLVGGGVPMIFIPWLRRAQAKADAAWEDASNRLDA